MTDDDQPGDPDDPNVDELLADAREWWDESGRETTTEALSRKWQAGRSVRRAAKLVVVWLRMQVWLVGVGKRRSVSDGRLFGVKQRVLDWWHGWGQRPDHLGELTVAVPLVAGGVVLGAWASIQAAAAGANSGALVGLLWWTVGIGAAGVAISPWFLFPILPGVLRTVAARLWFLLLQLAHGGTAVVERETGELEIQPLWEAEEGWKTRTDDGDELTVDGEHVTRWWFNPFAFVVELGSNLDDLREEPSPSSSESDENESDDKSVAADGSGYLVPTGNRRAGSRELKPVDIADDEQLLSLIPLRPRLRNAASGAFARDGRDEALRKEGGQQQLSPLITLGFAFAALIVGFAMVHFTL